MSEGIRVAVVEDDARALKALVFQLSTAGFYVTGYASAEEFLRAYWGEFDCVLAAVALPGMNGLELQEDLRGKMPFVSVVLTSRYGDLSVAIRALKNGAVDFLEGPIDDAALLASIRRGAHLVRRRRAEDSRRVELESRYSALTPREREAFTLITKGLLNKQVGAELGITERTVKAHRFQLMTKMNADSLAALVRMADILQVHAARHQSMEQL